MQTVQSTCRISVSGEERELLLYTAIQKHRACLNGNAVLLTWVKAGDPLENGKPGSGDKGCLFIYLYSRVRPNTILHKA